MESSDIAVHREKESTFQVSISGRLTLHGVIDGESLVAHVALGVDTFRAFGEFTVLQTNYGLKVAQIACGTLKLQDELKCSFYILGRKGVRSIARRCGLSAYRRSGIEYYSGHKSNANVLCSD